MVKSEFFIESTNRKLLPGVLTLIFFLPTVLSVVNPCQAREASRQKTLREVSREWMKVGIEQYRRMLFEAAGQSFHRAQNYQEYLTAAERQQLSELMEETSIAQHEKLRQSEFLTKQEREQTAEGLRQIDDQLLEPKRGVIETPKPVRVKEQAEPVSPPRITFVPGDVIEAKFFYTPELNVTQTVRPDGKIALQLVGEIMAQDRTPAELRDELLKLYAHHLKAPDITVIVRSFYDRRVFVGGEVMSPGTVELPGKMTVLEAIMQVGGFDLREAEVRNVVVIRHRGSRRYGYAINLKAALAGDDTRPFYLEPKDIVYVPRTKIAKIGQWIDQHINKLIPRTGFIFTVPVGDGRVGVY